MFPEIRAGPGELFVSSSLLYRLHISPVSGGTVCFGYGPEYTDWSSSQLFLTVSDT